ncbi:MAG: hypothetical protein ACPG5B_16050 [Chitinophagales bacterium]
MNIKFAKEESQYLGIKIGRLEQEKLNIADLQQEILEQEYDVIKIRVPSTDSNMMQRLDEISLPFSISDTVFHYKAPFQKMGFVPYVNKDIVFEMYRKEQFDLLQKIAMQTFSENYGAYFTHSIFDKIVSREKKLQLFGRWTASFFPEKDNGKITWLAKHKGEYIGFMAIQRINNKEWEPVIAGILPKYRKAAYFIDLIRSVRNYCVKHEIAWTYAKSQAQNINAYRAYVSENMSMYKMSVSVNINSLLSYSSEKKVMKTINISSKKNTFLESANNYIFQKYGENILIEKTLQTVLQDFSEPQKMEMHILTSYENEKKALKVFKFYVFEKIVGVVYIFLQKVIIF